MYILCIYTRKNTYIICSMQSCSDHCSKTKAEGLCIQEHPRVPLARPRMKFANLRLDDKIILWRKGTWPKLDQVETERP